MHEGVQHRNLHVTTNMIFFLSSIKQAPTAFATNAAAVLRGTVTYSVASVIFNQ
jgi:hypothetical protein